MGRQPLCHLDGGLERRRLYAPVLTQVSNYRREGVVDFIEKLRGLTLSRKDDVAILAERLGIGLE
ncbi:hypothetical protein [Mycobacterium asiaticum]|uniref:hypothetical protein n=1 Tax=Mycobacterium asiaticum TaxID=1790 RepID=UPI0007EF7BD9|nr:hypothetical protein [Mycobacterium asiaticum]OBJ62506.1 hypothetical protein A9W94_11835 [Mycobacterium asiaticum]